MLLPALLIHVNSAFSAVVNMGFSFLSTYRTIHWLPPGFYSYLISYLSVKQSADTASLQRYLQVSTATDES